MLGCWGDPRTGISAFLGKLLTPVFSNSGVLFFFPILTVIITILLTNFMINMVVAVIMITATMPIAASLGILFLAGGISDYRMLYHRVYVTCIFAGILLFVCEYQMGACKKYVEQHFVPTILMMAIVALGWNFILFMF